MSCVLIWAWGTFIKTANPNRTVSKIQSPSSCVSQLRIGSGHFIFYSRTELSFTMRSNQDLMWAPTLSQLGVQNVFFEIVGLTTCRLLMISAVNSLTSKLA